MGSKLHGFVSMMIILNLSSAQGLLGLNLMFNCLDLKFSDRYVLGKQCQPISVRLLPEEIRVYTVFKFVCGNLFYTIIYSKDCLSCMVITNFLGCANLRILQHMYFMG